MENSILLQNVSTEQLENLIDERIKKSLEEFKKEQNEKQLVKQKDNCLFFKRQFYILRYIIPFLGLIDKKQAVFSCFFSSGQKVGSKFY